LGPPAKGANVHCFVKHWDHDGIARRGHRPNSKMLASGSNDHTIKLWDVATGKEKATFQEHTDRVLSLALSPIGKMLASGSRDKTIKLWQLPTQ
jgi:WD40 repeat protein